MHKLFLDKSLAETSPVGMFPTGASPYHVLDLTGNVWESTRSRWGHHYRQTDFPYPYRIEDGREAMDSADGRVLRGGSWYDEARYTRCAYRDGYGPVSFNSHVCFRVVVSLAFSDFWSSES